MENKKAKIKVALYGYGTVGEAVARFITSQTSLLMEKSGVEILLAYIIDRDPSSITINDSRIVRSDDLSLPISDPDVSIVIELIGEVKAALALSKSAIEKGKHIVTANKALIAEHGAELCALAHEKNVCIAFEASCGGAIPILRALYGGLVSNRIDALYAIINGTCNYILTKMTEDGLEYDVALREAQKLGFAEANPELDVTGGDSAHKLAIMTTLAYGYRVSYKDIHTIGIDKIERVDIEYGKKMGLQMKLIAMSKRYKDTFIATVRPTFLSKDHYLRQTSGSYNAVSVYGNASGHMLFYGQGAGGDPTASAVISDIIGVSSGEIPTAFHNYSHWPDTSRSPQIAPWTTGKCHYYIRLTIDNQPGALANVTCILAKEKLNIAAVHQEEVQDGEGCAADVVITILNALESKIFRAVEHLRKISRGVYPIPILDTSNDAN